MNSHNSAKLVWVQNPEWVSDSPNSQHPAIASCISFFFFFLMVSTCLGFILYCIVFSKGFTWTIICDQKSQFFLLFITPVCLILRMSLRTCELTTKLFPFCTSQLKWFMSLQFCQVDDGGIDRAIELVRNVYMFGAGFFLTHYLPFGTVVSRGL